MGSIFSLTISLNLRLHCEHWVVQRLLFLHQIKCSPHVLVISHSLAQIEKVFSMGAWCLLPNGHCPPINRAVCKKRPVSSPHWISKPSSPGLITAAPLIFLNKTREAAVIRITSPHAVPKCPKCCLYILIQVPKFETRPRCPTPVILGRCKLLYW